MDNDNKIKIKKSSAVNQVISVGKDNVADVDKHIIIKPKSSDSHTASNSSFQIYNQDGHARISLRGKSDPSAAGSFDSWISYWNYSSEGPARDGWVVGLDSHNSTATLSNSFVWNALEDDGGTVPSDTSRTKMSLTQSGNLTVDGTVTSSAGICGGPKVTNYITNDADDTMVGTLTIDKNTSGDGAEDATALHVDYDRTVASSGTNAHNDIGIDLDINSASLGSSTVKGMDIDVVGATSGTHLLTGIDINVSGGDKNYGLDITSSNAQIFLRHTTDPSNDYARFFYQIQVI